MDELSTRNSTQDVPLGETLISPALDEGAAQGVVVVAKSRRPAKPQSSKKKRSARGAKSSRRKTASRSHGAAPANSESAAGKARRSFPASTFGEALVIAQGVQQYASGQKIRRLTLFDNLQKSPESGPRRQLITNSSKYGLT